MAKGFRQRIGRHADGQNQRCIASEITRQLVQRCLDGLQHRLYGMPLRAQPSRG